MLESFTTPLFYFPVFSEILIQQKEVVSYCYDC